MYQKYLLKISLSIIPIVVIGQNSVVAQKEKIVDYYNYYMVEFMLVPGTKYAENFHDAYIKYGTKNSISELTYDRIESSIPPNLPKTLKLCKELKQIKANLPSSVSINELPYYLVETLHSETGYANSLMYPELNTIYKEKQLSNYDKFSTFKKNLTQKLKEKITITTGNPPKKSSTMADWITEHIILVVAGLLFLIWLSYIYSAGSTDTKLINAQKKLKEKVAEELNKYKQQINNRETIDKNQYTLNQLHEERLQKLEDNTFGGVWAAYLELKEYTNHLSAQIKKLEAKTMSGKSGSSTQTTTVIEKTVSPESTEVRRQLFFPVPDKKTGQFRAILGKDDIIGYSVYQFEIDAKNENRASFSLIKTEKVQTAVLNFPESYLLHACDAEGMPGINKKIEPIVQGIARHEGDYWIIEQKAKIRYV